MKCAKMVIRIHTHTHNENKKRSQRFIWMIETTNGKKLKNFSPALRMGKCSLAVVSRQLFLWTHLNVGFYLLFFERIIKLQRIILMQSIGSRCGFTFHSMSELKNARKKRNFLCIFLCISVYFFYVERMICSTFEMNRSMQWCKR